MSRARLGAWGEAVAGRHLAARGYRIRAANWRVPGGELDLVALDGETVVFVEVKTRSDRTFGAPEESLTRLKRRKLIRTAWAYLEAEGLLDSDWRIDFIAIERGSGGRVARLDHYENAVEADPSP